MFVRVILVLTYFFIIFIGSRLIDVSVSVVGVTGLSFLCQILPKSFRFCGLYKQQFERREETSEDNDSRSREGAIQHEDAFLHDDRSASLDTQVDAKSIDFISYDHFLENVEDTKASAWVIWVRPSRNRSKHDQQVGPGQCGKNDTILNAKDWSALSRKLINYGIRTGTYKCARDTKLCRKHGIESCSMLLSMPAGAKPKGKVATHLYRNRSSCGMHGGQADSKICLLEWIKGKLKSKILMLSGTEDLPAILKRSKSSGSRFAGKSSLRVVYESRSKLPPLLISALSVRFTGRIKFVQMKSQRKKQSGRPFELSAMHAMTLHSNYSYGFREGEEFHFSHLDMFFRTLYPEANDIFLLMLVFINLCCLFELFVQKGGPLRRLICFTWIAFISNSLLIFTWLPIMRVLQFPETGPLIEFLLKVLQAAMFSEVAAMVRKDVLLLSQHIGVFCVGLVLYGSAVGYLRFIISNRGLPRPTLISLWVDDVNEIKEFFHSLVTLAAPPLFYFDLEERLENLLQRLSMPDLWLHPLHSSQYVRHLICWKFCKRLCDSSNNKKTKLSTSKKCNEKCTCQLQKLELPKYAMQRADCVVCLENYNCGEIVKLLPCGHCFHKGCIDCWLLKSCEYNNRKCPVCRWPANKQKYFSDCNECYE